MRYSSYDPAITPILCYHLAGRGLTDSAIAELLSVKPSTFRGWRRIHPELKEAMKPSKDFVDSLVEGSLLKRALGYPVEEVTEEPTGKGRKRRISKVVKKAIPPDVVACIFWLKNRKPMHWKDKNHLVVDDPNEFDWSRFSDDQLRQVAAIEATSGNGNGAGKN